LPCEKEDRRREVAVTLSVEDSSDASEEVDMLLLASQVVRLFRLRSIYGEDDAKVENDGALEAREDDNESLLALPFNADAEFRAAVEEEPTFVAATSRRSAGEEAEQRRVMMMVNG
jgi:hypothetical protein